jgi:hypothetical protein
MSYQSKAYPSDTPAENALLKEVGTDIHNDGSLIPLDAVTGLGAPFGRAPVDSAHVDTYLCCVEAECPFYYLRDSSVYVHESCLLGYQRHPLTYVGHRRFWYGPLTKYGS